MWIRLRTVRRGGGSTSASRRNSRSESVATSSHSLSSGPPSPSSRRLRGQTSKRSRILSSSLSSLSGERFALGSFRASSLYGANARGPSIGAPDESEVGGAGGDGSSIDPFDHLRQGGAGGKGGGSALLESLVGSEFLITPSSFAAQPLDPRDCPDWLDPITWARVLDLRAVKVTKEYEIIVKDAHLTLLQKELSRRVGEEEALKRSIETALKSLRAIREKEEKAVFDLNFFMRVKQGQVEMDHECVQVHRPCPQTFAIGEDGEKASASASASASGSASAPASALGGEESGLEERTNQGPGTDGADVADEAEDPRVVIDRSVVEKLNEVISVRNHEKVAILEECRDARREMFCMQWECKRWSLALRHKKQLIQDLQLLKGTKELLQAIREGDDEQGRGNDEARMQKRLEVAHSLHGHVNERKHARFSLYRSRNKAKRKENTELEDKITTAEEMMKERQRIANMRIAMAAPNNPRERWERFRNIMTNTELRDMIKEQDVEIRKLREEVTLLQKRNFPMFEVKVTLKEGKRTLTLPGVPLHSSKVVTRIYI